MPTWARGSEVEAEAAETGAADDAAGGATDGVAGLTDSSRFHIAENLPLCWKTGMRVTKMKPGELGFGP